MPSSRRIAKLVRFRQSHEPDSPTLYFFVEVGRRGEYLRPGEVPEFDGDEAWFELERAPKGPGRPWPSWRVVRQVERGP